MKNLISVMLVVFLPLTLAPQTPRVPVKSETQHRFKVYVSVEGDDATTTGILTSHLKRELRALGDVDIVGVDDDWEYIVSVTWIFNKTKSGVKTGILSIASFSSIRLPNTYFADGFHDTLAVFPGVLGIAIWKSDNLQEWCISRVGTFNDKYLELARSILLKNR